MFQWLTNLFGRPELSSFDQPISRERLIQSARIVVIDDEHSLLADELHSTGFAVDEDTTGDDLQRIDQQIYDLAILDYHGVGKRLGPGQGLDLLKHIRRVSPRTRVMAYTSRSLTAAESEFFRLSHTVLPKDLSLVDSLAAIEEELRKAFGKQHLFDALLTKLGMSDSKAKEKARLSLIKALRSNDETGFKTYVKQIAGTAAEKAVDMIVSRLFGGT